MSVAGLSIFCVQSI